MTTLYNLLPVICLFCVRALCLPAPCQHLPLHPLATAQSVCLSLLLLFNLLRFAVVAVVVAATLAPL